jgi:hypothetical protein
MATLKGGRSHVELPFFHGFDGAEMGDIHLRRLWFTPAGCVYVPPGARLLLRDISANLQRQLDVQATEEVTFVQLSAEAYEYRDAVRFRNGREVLLQRLKRGQRVKVLSLCCADSREGEHQRREEEYRRIFVG